MESPKRPRDGKQQQKAKLMVRPPKAPASIPTIRESADLRPVVLHQQQLPPRGPLSLASIAVATLQQNIHHISSLVTTQGPVPFHLIQPILARATLSQLDHIVASNAYAHPHILDDADHLYRPHVLNEFKDLARDASALAELNPPSWRDLYIEKMDERMQRMERARENLRSKNRKLAEEKGVKKVVVIDKPIQIGKRAAHWSNGGTVRKENRFMSAARKEIARKRTYEEDRAAFASMACSSTTPAAISSAPVPLKKLRRI